MTCDQWQCRSKKIHTLHSGYVRHRSRGEEACEASRIGHNTYVRNKISTTQKEKQPQ